MNIKQALLHNTGWKIITMLCSFVSNIIIVRLLGAAQSADLFYALAIFTLLGTILRAGLENGIVYYTSRSPAQTKPIALLICGVTTVQAVITYFALRYFIKESVGYSLIWTTVFVAGNILIWYLTAFYQAKKMFISINVSATIIAFLQLLAFCLFYFSQSNFLLKYGIANNIKDAVLIIMAGGLLLHLLLLVIYFYFRNRTGNATTQANIASPRNIFSYSLANFAGTVLLFLVMRADFYFVEKYCSHVELANYVQVARIGQMALVFPGLLGGVIFPFTVNAADTFTHKIAFFCRLLTMIFLVLFLGFLFTGKYIFVRLLGADFSLVHRGLLGTFAGIFCLAVNLVLISYYEGRNKQKIILLSNAATLAIILAGDHFFVPEYGFMAAAVIFSIANLAGMLILLRYFIKQTGFSLQKIFLFGREDSFVFRFWK